MCVPMPPLFFDLPLRQMMLPFIGPLPVNSQLLAIQLLLDYQRAIILAGVRYVASPIDQAYARSRRRATRSSPARGGLSQPSGLLGFHLGSLFAPRQSMAGTLRLTLPRRTGLFPPCLPSGWSQAA